jgi:outer membrane usher protein
MRSRHRSRLRRTLPPALLSALLSTHAFAQPEPQLQPQPQLPAPAAAAPRERMVPLEVTINTVQVGSWALLERDGALFAPEEALEEWRIQKPNVAPLVVRGTNWYPLRSVAGFQARMNAANQSVELVFSPAAFAATRVAEKAEERPAVTPAEPALFLNFDTNLSVARLRNGATARALGFISEVGFASQLGLLTSSFLGRNLLGNTVDTGRTFLRLETTFTRDFPDQNLTLRLGDGITRAGTWGRAVYFGGVQLSRNFSLTPGFVTQPIPLITGASSAPSTVELYVNDALRQTSSVPTGPFVVQNFPVLTGSGEARVVVRDVLGRETVIVQPFFTDSQLLAEGLSDWSIDAGAIRKHLGEKSASYGEGFTTGTYKYGLSPTSTLETRGELSPSVRNIGLGLTQGLFARVLAQFALAGSHDGDGRSGYEWLIGLANDSVRHGFSLRAQGASPFYAQLGVDPDAARRRRESAASYTYNTDHLGSFGASFARLETYGSPALNTLSLSYATRIGERSSFTVSAARVTGAVRNNSVSATLTVPLDNRVTVGANYNHHGKQNDSYVSADQGLAGDTGLAWRVLAGARNDAAFSEAGLRLYSEKALLTADISASADQQALRLGAQGGVVFVGGKTYLTQRVQDSFALVQVPGFANVGVGFHGRTLVHTDAEGFALLPRLMPYQVNTIRLNANDLPINAQLDNIELPAVPAARSAVKIVFPVRSGRGALLRIVFDDGEPAPAGAEVELVGDQEAFFVARRGESFVTGMKDRNQVRLKWKGATCTLDVNLPPGAVDEIARVGPLTCQGVKR